MKIDVRKRHDLAFAWLYQEYVYLSILDSNKKRKILHYVDYFEYLQEKADQRDG